MKGVLTLLGALMSVAGLVVGRSAMDPKAGKHALVQGPNVGSHSIGIFIANHVDAPKFVLGLVLFVGGLLLFFAGIVGGKD